MAISNIDFSVNFFVDKNSSKFVVTDITDYVPQGVVPTDVIGLIKIVSPSGVYYENIDFSAPDISLSVSRVNDLILIPTYTGTNLPVKGNYSITLTVSDDLGVTKYSKVKSFNYNIDKPTEILDITVDCISPELKSQDNTQFNIGGVNPLSLANIVGVDSPSNSVSVSENLTGLYVIGNKVNLVGSQSNDGEYTISSVNYNVTNNTTVIEFDESLTNNTVGGLLYTRVNKIFYPSVLSLNPLVGFTNTITTSTFYTGNQEFLSSGYFFYNFINGFSVTFYLEKTASKNITCDIRLCDIYCCISKTLNNYLNYKGVNDVLANGYKNAYVLACSYLTSLQTQMKCGNTSNLDKIVDEIRSVTGCTSECNCEESDNVLIQGLGASGNVDVVSSSSQLKVVSTVSGSTTTFTLSLDPSVINALSNIVSITLGNSSTINVNEVIDINGNKTYTPALVSGIIPEVKEQMSFMLEIQYRFSTSSFNVRTPINFVISNVENVAQLDFVAPTVEDRASSTLVNYPNSNNAIALTAFQASSQNFKVFAEVVRTTSFNAQGDTIDSTTNLASLKDLKLKILKSAVNDIVFTMFDDINLAPTQSYITANYQSVLINFLITK